MWESGGGSSKLWGGGGCFWCNDGLALEVVIGWGKGGVGVPIWWRGTGWGVG